VTAGAAAIIVSVKSEWDPNLDLLTAWLPRARILHEWHHIEPSMWGSFLDPWYPPLVPTIDAVTFDFVGGFHPSLLPFQQTLLGLAFVLAAFALVDPYTPSWISLPSLSLLLSAPWFWWRLQSLLPDQTVAYLIAGAGLACVVWLLERRGAWLGVALVLLTAATLTKLEGLLFASLLVVVVVTAGAVLYRRAALPAAVLVLGPAAIVPWQLWLAHHDVATWNQDFNTPHAVNPSFLADRVERFSAAVRFMLRTPFIGPDYQAATIICLFVAVLVVVARWLPSISAVVGAWLALSFLGLASIYWISDVEVNRYLSTSASRVGGTIIVAAAVLTPLLLGLALRTAPAAPALVPTEDATVPGSLERE
jgi:hypothetical protein